MKLLDRIRKIRRVGREIGFGHVGAIILELAQAAIEFSATNPGRCVNPNCTSTRCRLVNASHGLRGLVAMYWPEVMTEIMERYAAAVINTEGQHAQHGAN